MSEIDTPIFGPYEFWAFDVSAARTVFERDCKRFRFHTAIAEAPHKLSLTSGLRSSDMMLGADHPTKVTPIVFPRVLRQGPELKFLPLIIADKGDRTKSVNGAATCNTGKLLREINSRPQQAPHALPGARTRLTFPITDKTIDPNFAPASEPGGGPVAGTAEKPPKVIVAVIDEGIPFAHRDLRDTGGRTTLDYCWLQAADAGGTGAVPFGRELTGADIDSLIQRHGRNEDAIYRDRQSGAVNTSRDQGFNIFRRVTHGAHILNTAAGCSEFEPDEERGAMDAVRVIAVQLPRNALRDTSGIGKEVFLLAALHYIVDRANAIAKAHKLDPLPLLVNASLGITGGPHDGSTQLETAIDEILGHYESTAAKASRSPLVMMALPAGNSFQIPIHGTIRLDQAAAEGSDAEHPSSFAIPWRLQPNDRTSNFLELWFDGEEDPRTLVSIDVRSPTGEALQRVPVNGPPGIERLTLEGREIGQISFDRHRGQRWRAIVILAPTSLTGPDAVRAAGPQTPPVSPSGLWRVAVTALDPAKVPEVIECYIHRDEDPADTGTGARQSYFDHSSPAGKRYPHDGSQFVDAAGTINGWATSREPAAGPGQQKKPVAKKIRYAVGGFVGDDWRYATDDTVRSDPEPAPYSSTGPNGRGPSVDYSALSEQSPVLPGRRGAGTRTGSYVRLRGTSTVAPALIRLLALEAAFGKVIIDIDRRPHIDGQAQTDHPRLGRVVRKRRRRGASP